MNNILRAIIVITGIFILVLVLVGNTNDSIVLKSELTINSSKETVSSYITDINKFREWFPNSDTVYTDSLDAEIWLIERTYKGKSASTKLRVTSGADLIRYKMWTEAFISNTEISLEARAEQTVLTSRTNLDGNGVLLSGLNRLGLFRSKDQIDEGYESLKRAIEENYTIMP